MPAVKSLDRISKKWARVAQASQAEYEEGVRNPRKNWAEETAAAEGRYEQGIQKSITDKRFGKGVRKAGQEKWQRNSVEKGVSRWADGIRLSTDNYESGFAPYRTVIENVKLPERGPKGDPKNIQRVAAIATALHAEKLKRQGA